MYSDIAESISTEAYEIETLMGQINSIPISDGWYGSASVNLSGEFTKALESLSEQLTQVHTFAGLLIKLDEYKSGKERYESLKNYYYSIPNTKENSATKSSIASEANSLSSKLSTLRKEIVSGLNSIGGVESSGGTDFNVNLNTNTNASGLDITNPTYDGRVLSPSMGRSANGPQAEETWYDLDMGYVTERMSTVYGIPIETWVDPNTGVKMCKKQGDDTAYVMVAADVHNVWGGNDRNPNATYSMGDVVLTSWGPGMIVDYCGEAVQYREQGKNNRFDIATAWGSGYYQQGQSAANAANSKDNEEE